MTATVRSGPTYLTFCPESQSVPVTAHILNFESGLGRT
jgi:hypothetical protein